MTSRPTTPPPAGDLADARFRNLLPGDTAPWFRARAATNPGFMFDTVGGRYVLLAFIGSTHEGPGEATAKALMDLKPLFSANRLIAFAISADPRDESEARLVADPPGVNVFWDFDLNISRLYGTASEADPQRPAPVYRPLWYLLDPALRVMQVFVPPTDAAKAKVIRDYLEQLPEPDRHSGGPTHAPVLIIPRVFEMELCCSLIAYYDNSGGEPSGFMRDVDGKTTLVLDPSHKRRRDVQIDDRTLMNAARERVRRRIVPQIKKAFQFDVTRIERDIVACYTAEDAGHFRAHRDNTTKGTAHRRWAVSINLNEEFEGGTLSFPEFGSSQYKPPPGGAVVFSCDLLHQVAPVTRGHRYAYLPFLYDDAAARIREANNAFLDQSVGEYRAADPEPAKARDKPEPAKVSALDEDKPII